MGIQSQDIEKQRQTTEDDPRPNEQRTQPHDRAPGQPHDAPPRSGKDNTVERDPSHDSLRESKREEQRRRELDRQADRA